jgi:hypothetical protein
MSDDPVLSATKPMNLRENGALGQCKNREAILAFKTTVFLGKIGAHLHEKSIFE